MRRATLGIEMGCINLVDEYSRRVHSFYSFKLYIYVFGSRHPSAFYPRLCSTVKPPKLSKIAKKTPKIVGTHAYFIREAKNPRFLGNDMTISDALDNAS